MIAECKAEYQEIAEKVPVTKCVWTEEVVVTKVPHIVVKKVSCTKIVRVPICSSLTGPRPSIYGGTIISPTPGGKLVPAPQARGDAARDGRE